MHDDGAEQQTLVLSYGSYQERIVLTEPERERLAYGDWRGWEEWIARIPAYGGLKKKAGGSRSCALRQTTAAGVKIIEPAVHSSADRSHRALA
jgi:hypothetical protein